MSTITTEVKRRRRPDRPDMAGPDCRLHIRVHPDLKRAAQQSADQAGMTLSRYMEDLLMTAMKKT